MAATLAACSPPSVTLRAMSLARQHHDDEAVALLRRELVKHPENLEARRLLVRLLGSSGHLDQARTEVTELARRLPPNDPTPSVELGHALELAHQYEDALAQYDHAAEMAPTNPLGPREGGMRAARWGESAIARPRLEEAVKRGAHDEELFHALGLVRLHDGELDAAAEAYEKGLAEDPKALECLLGLASVAVVKGDGALALKRYDAILNRRPSYAPASLGRAWALGKLHRVDAANQELDHALELGATPATVAKLRGRLTHLDEAGAKPPSVDVDREELGAPADPAEPGAPRDGHLPDFRDDHP